MKKGLPNFIATMDPVECRTSPHWPKVALISSGLGNTNRGFEISTARWFEALKEYTDLNVRLFCGGHYPDAKQLWNFPRNSIWTRPIHYIPFVEEKNRWEITYGVEQVSFWSALNFELLEWKPDVVWVKDYPLVHMICASRKVFRLPCKIIFANGGLKDPSTYKGVDFVQQIMDQAFEQALSCGIAVDKMEVLPNCIPEFPASADRLDVRSQLDVASDDWLVTCVAAWNKYHKRIDYLIEEVAEIKDDKVKLILVGNPEVDTPALKSLGKKLLGNRIKWLTVAPEAVPEILRASDVFVLPTLDEFFGNSLLEAALCGLPVITHPHAGARCTLNDEFWMTDLSSRGNLAARLIWVRENYSTVTGRMMQLQSQLASRFAPDRLANRFKEMVVKVAANDWGNN